MVISKIVLFGGSIYLMSTHANKKCSLQFVKVMGPVLEQRRVGRFGMTSVRKISPARRKIFDCCC